MGPGRGGGRRLWGGGRRRDAGRLAVRMRCELAETAFPAPNATHEMMTNGFRAEYLSFKLLRRATPPSGPAAAAAGRQLAAATPSFSVRPDCVVTRSRRPGCSSSNPCGSKGRVGAHQARCGAGQSLLQGGLIDQRCCTRCCAHCMHLQRRGWDGAADAAVLPQLALNRLAFDFAQKAMPLLRRQAHAAAADQRCGRHDVANGTGQARLEEDSNGICPAHDEK